MARLAENTGLDTEKNNLVYILNFDIFIFLKALSECMREWVSLWVDGESLWQWFV